MCKNVAVDLDGSTDDPRDRLGSALAAAGITVRPDGRMLAVEIADEHTTDTIRDLVTDLDLSLVRMHQRRHRIEEVFRDGEDSRVGA